MIQRPQASWGSVFDPKRDQTSNRAISAQPPELPPQNLNDISQHYQEDAHRRAACLLVCSACLWLQDVPYVLEQNICLL